jgi:hypothetical protein
VVLFVATLFSQIIVISFILFYFIIRFILIASQFFLPQHSSVVGIITRCTAAALVPI